MRVLRTNLTTDRTPFIGRQRELALLADDLRRGSRLLTITGPSGMGKTRLARQAAAAAASDFHGTGGTWFCSAAACNSPCDLEAALARALELPRAHGGELVGAIANRGPLLLVLDELNAIAPACADLLGSLLAAAPELRILVTSIVPTGAPEELRFELGPLEPADAVALYLDAARRAWADRSFPEAETGVIEELVRRLDRIPLALELAAARIRVLPPGALLERISERFDLLQGGGESRSLAKAISLTWEMLSPPEKWALARASVFVGGFTLEAAEAVLGTEHGSPLDLLDALRSKTLVQLGESRFSLYESIRDFAALHLRKSGDEEEALRRHAAFFLHHAEIEARRADGPDGPRGMRWLLAECENLWSIHLRSSESDPHTAVRAGLAVAVAHALQGPPGAENHCLDCTVETARRAGEPTLLTRALRFRAFAARKQGRLDEARLDLDELVREARAAGVRIEEGFGLVDSAALRARHGDAVEAEREAREALEIGRELGELLMEGMAHGVLGLVSEASGRLEEAAPLHEKALALFRKHGNLALAASALRSLGAIRSEQGRFREARHLLEEARTIFSRLEYRGPEAECTLLLGSLFLAAGFLDEARAHAEQALLVERELGSRRYEALALGTLGLVALERGELREAETRLSEGLAILGALADRRGSARLLAFLAATDALLDRAGEARHSLDEAQETLRSLGDEGSLRLTSLVEGLLDLAEARTAPHRVAAEALVARARELSSSPPRPINDGLAVVHRLLERALREGGKATDLQRLVIGPEAGWFELAGAERVDIRRRGALRLILQGLVEQRLLSPGAGINQQALAEIGWPGERILPEAAATRVYTAIRTLRSLGLGAALRRHADGYLLDPDLTILREG